MSEARLEALARAKLNLFLHVGSKRPDGYHALSSWVAFAALGDKVTADAREAGIEFAVEGPFAADAPSGTENLVMQAAYALFADYGEAAGRGAKLRLNKLLPVAGGIGGGSADAAATLHLLNELWGLGIDGQTLMEIGLSLGSDVPVCIYNRSAMMGGRGEIVRPAADLPPISLVLANPGVPLSTADVFARLSTRTGTGSVYLPPDIRDAGHLAAALANTGNDLEAPAIALAPAIGETLQALRSLPGVLMARLSGSGATCFALVANDAQAQSGAVALKRARPGWWVAATRLDC